MNQQRQSPLSPRIWLGLAVAMSLVLVAAMAMYPLLPSDTAGRTRWLLGFLDLARENSLASWFCGMMFLVSALKSFDGWVELRRVDTKIAKSWLQLAVVLLALSFDEMGSVHERLELLEYGTAAVIVPAALVLAALVFSSLRGFFGKPELRRSAAAILLAFVLFATVPAQEALGEPLMKTPASSSFLLTLEEATELLGNLILFKVCLSQSAPGVNDRRLPEIQPFALVAMASPFVLNASIVVVPALAYWSTIVPDHFRGHPADWYTASLFLFCALAAQRESGSQSIRLTALLACGFLIASAAIAFTPESSLTAGLDISRRALVIAFGIIAAAGIRLMYTRSARIPALLAIGAILYAAGFEFDRGHTFGGYLLTQSIALYSYVVLTRFARARSVETG